jgi:hypothetical protein
VFAGELEGQRAMAATAAAAVEDGRAGVVPAAVRVQVRQLQPVLPGARGRAAGRAGHHRVLPGGVAVPVRQPPLHAMTMRPDKMNQQGAAATATPLRFNELAKHTRGVLSGWPG